MSCKCLFTSFVFSITHMPPTHSFLHLGFLFTLGFRPCVPILFLFHNSHVPTLHTSCDSWFYIFFKLSKILHVNKRWERRIEFTCSNCLHDSNPLQISSIGIEIQRTEPLPLPFFLLLHHLSGFSVYYNFIMYNSSIVMKRISATKRHRFAQPLSLLFR